MLVGNTPLTISPEIWHIPPSVQMCTTQQGTVQPQPQSEW